jgi:glycerate 2-kinase
VLVSGGGSALAEVPVPGISLEDLAATNRALLSCGADITTTNIIRRKLSRLKGGGLAAAIAPAKIVTLIVSDVVGDDPATIASGPTVSAADEPGAALDAVARLGLGTRLPVPVLDAIGELAEDRPAAPAQQLRLVAGASAAAHAAAAEAERRGCPAHVLDTRLTGNTGSVVGEVLERSRFGVSVFAGETTVEVAGAGVGGRNQEAALVAATLIAGVPNIWLLAAGTDGVDGMTDAAGAIVDGGTLGRAIAAGIDADRALECNDSGTFFATLGEQVTTGPTGTNVGDLWLVLRD